jgi:hypothetical protein
MVLGILGMAGGMFALSDLSAFPREVPHQVLEPAPGVAANALQGAATETSPRPAGLPVELLPSPAADGSTQPSLSPGRNGTVLMIWMERSANGTETFASLCCNKIISHAPDYSLPKALKSPIEIEICCHQQSEGHSDSE